MKNIRLWSRIVLLGIRLGSVALVALALFLSLNASAADINEFLNVGRLDFYRELLEKKLKKGGVDPALVKAVDEITPEEILSWNAPGDVMGDAMKYDDLLIRKIVEKHPELASQADTIRWNYPFFKRKLNEAFQNVPSDPKALAAPVRAPEARLADRSSAYALEALDESGFTFDVLEYIENRMTRGVFWDMAANNRQLELHLGSMRDFEERLERRGGKVLSEIKPWSRNYNKIFVIQYPGEAPKYAITGISGYDRLEHIARQVELVKWGTQAASLKKNVAVYGDLARKIEHDTQVLTRQFSNLPMPDRVVIGQKAAIEKAFYTAAKAEDVLALADKAEAEVSARLTPKEMKLIAAERKDHNLFSTNKDGSDWQKIYDKLKDLFAKHGINESQSWKLLEIENPSHDVADVVFKTKDGKRVRWRLIENVWGDEIAPVAKALKNVGVKKVTYIGTAGALPGKDALSVGDLFVPTAAYPSDTGVKASIAAPQTLPNGAKVGGAVENVASPYEETWDWLKKSAAQSRAVELEVGYVAREFPEVETYLLISDAVGTEHALDSLDSGKFKKAKLNVIDHLFEIDQAAVPVENALASAAEVLPEGAVADVLAKAAPNSDPAYRYYLTQKVAKEFPGQPVTEALLQKAMEKSPSFSSKMLGARLTTAGVWLTELTDRAENGKLAFRAYVKDSLMNGLYHPKSDKVELLLHADDQASFEALNQWIAELRAKDKNFSKFVDIRVHREMPKETGWTQLSDSLDGRISRYALVDLYSEGAYRNTGLIASPGKSNLAFKEVPITGKLQTCPPEAMQTCSLAYFAPNGETKKALQALAQDPEPMKKLETVASSIVDNEEFFNKAPYGLRIVVEKNAQLSDGAMAEIVPELGPDSQLIVKMRFTPEGAQNKLVVLEEFTHLRQILGRTQSLKWSDGTVGFVNMIGTLTNAGIESRFSTPNQWLETVLNAKAGSVQAKFELALAEKEAAQEVVNFIGTGGGTPEELVAAQARLEHANARASEMEPLARADKRERLKKVAARKPRLKELDAQAVKLDEMVAKNDRKGAAALIRQYLPWDVMEPSERAAWEGWLEAMANPSTKPEDQVLMFRGMKGDLIRESADKKSYFSLSTILKTGQGNYNFRLRRNTSGRENVFSLSKIQTDPSASIDQGLAYHAREARASPWLSLTPSLPKAAQFGTPLAALKMDARRAFPSVESYPSEFEHLASLIIFPDEVVHLERAEPGKSLDLQKFAQAVEQKTGIPVNTAMMKPEQNAAQYAKGRRELLSLMAGQYRTPGTVSTGAKPDATLPDCVTHMKALFQKLY